MIDLVGKTFGRLIVLKFANYSQGISPRRRWKCLCTCGKKTIAEGSNLRRGNTKSCGCLQPEESSKFMKGNKYGLIHDMSRTHIYKSWSDMKTRAFSHSARNSHLYINKGISIDSLWLDFTEFFIDMSSSWFDGASLHRINPFADYNRKNCQWLTSADHAHVHNQLKREGVYNEQ